MFRNFPGHAFLMRFLPVSGWYPAAAQSFVESDRTKCMSQTLFLTNSMGSSLYNDHEKGDVMYYELYADSLFLVNFVMNLYLLLLVNNSTLRTATRKRLILGAGVGALLYFLPLLCRGPVWFRLLVGMPPGCIAMILVAFGVRSINAFFRILERLLAYSLLMGGAMLFVIKSFPALRKFTAGMWGILGMGALLYLLSGYIREKRKNRDCLCRVTLICKGSQMTVTALLDSGNSLVEPISGKPVSIIEKDVISSLWKEEPRLYRAIPYHSIGRKRGILKGYLLPEIRIETGGVTKSCRETYVAVCEEYIQAEENDGGNPVKMILNPMLLNGETGWEVS